MTEQLLNESRPARIEALVERGERLKQRAVMLELSPPAYPTLAAITI